MKFGEISWDPSSFSTQADLGEPPSPLYYRKPFLGTLAVAPAVFCEAFVPSARRIFWKPQRFPIAERITRWAWAFLAEFHEQ